MPEIISLLSSSPPPVLSTTSQSTNNKVNRDEIGFSDISFDDGVFDAVLDLDFPVTRSAKRRRLSPKVILEEDLSAANAVFDLSSEADVELPQISIGSVGKASRLPYSDVFDGSFSAQVSPRRKLERSLPSKCAAVIHILSDDNALLDDPIPTSSQLPKTAKTSAYSEQTASILANLKSSSKVLRIATNTIAPLKDAKVRSYGKSTKFIKATTRLKPATAKVDDNIEDSSQAEASSHKAPTPALPSENVVTKKQSKPRKCPAEKESEKEKKKQEKEQKAAEKQKAADIAEVNKAKTNKKIAAKDILLELPSTMKGKSVANQVGDFMKEAEATVTFYDEAIDMTEDSIITTGHTIRWKRRVEAEFDKIKEEWVPIPQPKVQTEKHILVYLTAEEFCTVAAYGTSYSSVEDKQHPDEATMKENLDEYTALLRSRHPDVTIIILIQGLTAYLKKSANAKNREFAATVRSQNALQADEDTTASTSATARGPKKRKPTTPTIDLSFLNNDHSDALQLHLQLHHRPLNIVHTTSPHTTAHQIFTLTQHLATRPYRLAAQQMNLAHASFCMDGGQIKTGQGDARETFILMLQEVNRVTVSMAHGVLSQGYEGPASLVRAFKDVERKEGKEASRLMLKDVRKAMNKDGGLSDKPLGQMVSKRLYKVFMARDENLRDGIV